MNKAVIVGMARTPIGDFLGALSSLDALELGAAAAGAALERSGLQADSVDEVVCGIVYKAGTKGNLARQIQLRVGCPESGTASTIDQQCASGMRALELACQSVMLGKSDVVIAVGVESMSNVPHILPVARRGYRLGGGQLEDSLLHDALHDAMLGYHMGVTAENLAEKYGISRLEQDELALLSHSRACFARRQGLFDEEIVPVSVTIRKQRTLLKDDEHPRDDLTMDDLAKLRPAFAKEGTVTAGNASGINDGAASAVIMSDRAAKDLGIKVIAEVAAISSAGVSPEIMGIGPVPAIGKVLASAGRKKEDVDYYEINEAFAAQFIAVNRELGLPMEMVNANGSGIALGHPVGCTGLRIAIATIQELKRRGKSLGCAALCVGGGPAMATLISLPD